MEKGRLEAFSDGVIAIIITIMVLELKVPHGHDFAALAPLLPVFLSYVLSFIYVGIYWNNHHHLFQATERVIQDDRCHTNSRSTHKFSTSAASTSSLYTSTTRKLRSVRALIATSTSARDALDLMPSATS